jgi:hypothetical protein
MPQIFIQHFTQFSKKATKLFQKSDMILEVLMKNKISEKFVLTNESSLAMRISSMPRLRKSVRTPSHVAVGGIPQR